MEGRRKIMEDTLDATSRNILLVVSYLDAHGAATWSYRSVAAVSAATFLLVRYLSLNGKQFKGGIEWHALLHCIITSVGSSMCLYLDHYYAESIGGTPEPLRMIRCEGPLTSMHNILPAIALGYSLCDVLNGIVTSSKDYLLHGLSLGCVMLIMCEIGQQHTITQMLLMELSSTPLILMDATFLSPGIILLIQLWFAISFFLVRILLVPYLWWQFITVFVEEESEDISGMCFPHYFLYIVLLFGAIFHGLNFYCK